MSYSEYLHTKYNDLFQRSISHPLTNELCTGDLSDKRLLIYLVQDMKYFQIGLNVFGKILSLCENPDSMITLAKQIGFLAYSENTYLEDTIIEISKTVKINHDDTLPQVARYIEFMKYLNKSESYSEIVTAMYVMEAVYLGWANKSIHSGLVPSHLEYKYKEWIVLHSGDAFETWVLFLKSEVDRLGKSELSENIFKKTLEHEVEFFDACYDYDK